MTAEEIILKLKKDDTYTTFGFMLKGCGIDAKKSEFGKGRAFFEKLVAMGIVDKSKNHSRDNTGMYVIRDSMQYSSVEDCVTKRLIMAVEKYKGYDIRLQKNQFGYFEAVNRKDCDAQVLHAKTITQLKTEIDETTI